MSPKLARRCMKVTKKGMPCKNKAIFRSEYCLIHTLREKKGFWFWVMVVASLFAIYQAAIWLLPHPTVISIPKGHSLQNILTTVARTNNNATIRFIGCDKQLLNRTVRGGVTEGKDVKGILFNLCNSIILPTDNTSFKVRYKEEGNFYEVVCSSNL